MINKVKKILSESIPDYTSKKFLLATSGGIDSMVLLSIFQQIDVQFAVAHCNFNLRGDESESETVFLKEYCSDNTIDIFVKYFDTEQYTESNKVSIQIAARELRYSWFDELLEKNGYDFLITAHHLNDQIETFFINSLRATSVNGLRGIPKQNVKIFRPLLEFSRNEIHQFALTHSISWKEDSSNSSTKYIRNKIRHKIVPVLEELSPDVYGQFSKLFKHLDEDFLLKQDYIYELRNRFVKSLDKYDVFKWSLLQKETNGFIKFKQLVAPYGFDNDEELRKILNTQTGRSIYSSSHELLFNRGDVILRKNSNVATNNSSIFIEKDENNEIISLIFGTPYEFSNDNFTREISVDFAKIIEPFAVRPIKLEDYFQPLGMKGRKKISKYLKDIKLSKYEKESVRLLVDANDKIIWVIGFQMDDFYKVNKLTQKTIKITTR